MFPFGSTMKLSNVLDGVTLPLTETPVPEKVMVTKVFPERSTDRHGSAVNGFSAHANDDNVERHALRVGLGSNLRAHYTGSCRDSEVLVSHRFQIRLHDMYGRGCLSPASNCSM